MRIYFLRHGEADWPTWTAADSERPLTEKGIREMQLVAARIAALKLEPAALLSSPFCRAAQTAEILAAALGMTVITEPALAPGFGPSQLSGLIAKHSQRDLVLVGHEPDFSSTIRSLTGGEIKMAKAGFACVELVNAQTNAGELLWLVPPKIFKAGQA